MKKSSRILKNKQAWHKTIKQVMLIMIVLFILTEAYCIVEVLKKGLTSGTLCQGLTDILMQTYCSLAVSCFCVLTYFITRRINEHGEMVNEYSIAKVSQIKAKRL